MVEKNEENIIKAVNVAETAVKRREKKKTGKLMKIDETNEALPKFDRNMPEEEILNHMRALCNQANYADLYIKVECLWLRHYALNQVTCVFCRLIFTYPAFRML